MLSSNRGAPEIRSMSRDSENHFDALKHFGVVASSIRRVRRGRNIHWIVRAGSERLVLRRYDAMASRLRLIAGAGAMPQRAAPRKLLTSTQSSIICSVGTGPLRRQSQGRGTGKKQPGVCFRTCRAAVRLPGRRRADARNSAREADSSRASMQISAT